MAGQEQASNARVVSDMTKYLMNRGETWQNVVVNFAIIGDPGTGKSSFINAIRGIDDRDDNAVEIGITSTFRAPQCFPDPTNSKIRFWDLPSLGSPRFHNDLEFYCDEVKFPRYDVILIFSATRFTQNNHRLASKVKKLGEKFFFIRSKIDSNIEAEKRKKTFNEESVLWAIRQDCLECLGNLLTDERDIFLISSHFPHNWDFQRLKQAITTSLATFQRQSLHFLLQNESRQFVQENVGVFRSWIWKISIGSCIAGFFIRFPYLLSFDLLVMFA